MVIEQLDDLRDDVIDKNDSSSLSFDQQSLESRYVGSKPYMALCGLSMYMIMIWEFPGGSSRCDSQMKCY